MPANKSFRIAPFLILYSTAHLLVDAACAFLLLGILNLGDYIIAGLLIYNGLAFVLQAPLGHLIDKVFNPKAAAVLGLLLVASASVFFKSPFTALSLMGIGNALFHAGGGSQVLAIRKKTATYAGIFVAPGAVGLALGAYLANLQVTSGLMVFPLILTVMSVLLLTTGKPVFERKKAESHPESLFLLIAFLVLLPIVIRSLVGMAVNFPWKENMQLGLMLTASVALGKIAGGFLADRWGLVRPGVLSLLVAAPLLAFGAEIPVLALTGILVFNFSMPITLIALLNTMPNRKGLTFGLSTTALFVGALPVILNQHGWAQKPQIVFTLILIASLALLAALKSTPKIKPNQTNADNDL